MAVGVDSIDRLHLDLAFGKSLNDSWTIRSDSRMLVIDDDTTGISRFSDDPADEDRALVVLNTNNKVITLLSIDHQLIKENPGGIADCAVMDEKKISFNEFKTNALGNSEEAISATFEKASCQLKETLTVFNHKLNAVGVSHFQSMYVECRIIVAHRFPRATAAKQNFRAAFANETNGINLLFERLLVFE